MDVPPGWQRLFVGVELLGGVEVVRVFGAAPASSRAGIVAGFLLAPRPFSREVAFGREVRLHRGSELWFASTGPSR